MNFSISEKDPCMAHELFLKVINPFTAHELFLEHNLTPLWLMTWFEFESQNTFWD